MKNFLTSILLLSLGLACLYGAEASTGSMFNVTSSGPSQLKLEVSPAQPGIKESIKDGRTLREVTVPGTFTTATHGMPELPVLSTTIAIPPQGGYTLNYTYSDVELIPLENPLLHQNEDHGDPAELSPEGFFPAQVATDSEPAILRDFRVIQLNVYPYQYDAANNQLRWYGNIEVTLDFDDSEGTNELAVYTDYSYAFKNLYEAQIANFEDYRNLVIAPAQARILLIHGQSTDSVFLTKLNEFVTWKRQKGYDVTAVSTQVTGTSTSTIKNYIQTQYDNPNTRPDFIILMGDTTGSYAIPTYIENLSGYSGAGDYPYTHLAGSDQLGDVFIGRISAENLAQLTTILAKIYVYERDINIEGDAAAWLDRILLIGDPTYSGISTVYSNKYIRESSLLVNPDYTYIENYSGGYSSTMNTGINQGVSFFNYRGYIGMSGWSPSSSLINGPRLPHSVILTCGTGSFNYTSTSEEFIRLGTEAMPKGALTSIGMATSGTHTMFNNALSNGIFDGVFLHGMRSMGEALLNGRLNLWNVYGTSHTNQAHYFAHWCNLMGDPTVETFIGIPKQLAITAPDSIPRGTTYVDIAVTDDQMNPEENVSVTLFNSSYGNVVSKGFTNAQGEVTLFIPSFINSEIVITASKHDCKPVQRSLALDQSGSLVYFEKMTIDNGNQGSSGNGDGFIDAGETIALNLEIKNTTAQTITGISAQLSSPDPFVTIGQAQSDYPDITPEGTGLNSTPFLISFGNGISYQHDTRFVLNLTDTNSAEYELIFHLGSFNANLDFTNYSISAGGDGILDPAETGILSVSIKNNSICAVGDIYGELRSLNDLVSVTDSISYFGNAPAGMTINSVDGFSVFARPLLIPGMMIPFSLRLYNSEGFEQTTSFNVPIGSVTQNTPLGPDEYGYFIYDVSDTSYPDCPSYEWIEIVPSLGGSGTQITGLNDSGSSGDEGDQVGSDALETIDLPFTFPFYGVEYDEITVCVNGFIVFGITENGEFRNGRMPVGLGPSPMIAPFWDDLIILSGGGVYQYYDADEHIFIIQYNNLKNGYNRTSEETFQVIFYDPVHYPTSLGDGMIKFQYKVFNNIDSGGGGYTPIHGNFCTVGIRDHTNLRGLEYTYNNQYPQAAQPLTNLKALLVTTVPVLHESPHLVVGEMILNDANANSHLEPGETAQIGIKLNNLGLNTATNVNINAASTSPYLSFQNSSSAYPDIPGSGSAVNIYPLEINASMDCADGLVIPIEFAVTIDGGEWFYTMSLTIRKPSIEVSGVYINDIQGNGNGLSDPDETFSMIVNYTNNGSVDATNLTSNITCMSDDVTIHNPEQIIPVIPANTTCQAVYSVTLSPNVIVGNNITFYLTYIGDSIDAQNEQVLLNVGTTGMMEDFETTNGDFLPQPNDNGWQWGVDTTAGAHSGTMVWGTLLNQQYPNNANWTLTSPSVFVGANFVLEFWHYFNTESNYDGGNVKISTNNGSTWTLLTPYGGYNQSNVSALNGPGYAGNSNGWVQARFDLGAFANQSVRFRWVFASDTMIQGQGWYIDDVQTTGFVPFAGKLSGAVASSNPDIDFSSVLIQNPAAIATQPDTEGNYTLFLPAGAHSVTALAPGYLSDIYAVDLDIPNPAVEHDYFLGYFSPATGLDYDVEQDTLHLTWAAPADPLYPVQSYKVFKRLNAGAYELMGIYA
ncbi:MAG: C25 family cysteine peptidase, partial [Candidatus Syntrophosphaera sp.]